MWYVYKNETQYIYSRTQPVTEYATVNKMPPKPNKVGYTATLQANIDKNIVWWELKESTVGKKTNLISTLSTQCNQTITSGVDVTLTNNETKHYSLTENDQINLTNAVGALQAGATHYLYHADDELCEKYSADDIMLISVKATEHKIYHTTYFNHLKSWVNRVETIEELDAITYGAELPTDLQEHMMELLSND